MNLNKFMFWKHNIDKKLSINLLINLIMIIKILILKLTLNNLKSMVK